MVSMVASIKRHKAFLYMLRYAGYKRPARIEILRNLNPGEVKVILELCANALHGVLPLTRPQKKILRTIKPLILALLSSDITLQHKKLLMIKHHSQTYLLVNTIFKTLLKFIWHQQ